MKIATTPDLMRAYAALYPSERLPMTDDTAQTFNNWLDRYVADPDKAMAVSKTTWCGKMTAALFHALQIKLPRTKTAMREALK